MKQLNFAHFNTNSNTIPLKQYFFSERNKKAPKWPILFCLVYHFSDFSGAVDNAIRLRTFHEKPSKHLTLFSPGTVNNNNNNKKHNRTLKIMGKYHLTLNPIQTLQGRSEVFLVFLLRGGGGGIIASAEGTSFVGGTEGILPQRSF